MPIAYSYKRFSSDAQEGNDSIRRQTAAAQKFVEEHPEHLLVLDTTLSLTDAGVSAYKGRNIKTGTLGVFIDAVKDNLIPEGSWLLLESFDRFTRQSVNIAANELLNLINQGIVVVTLHNETIYRLEDFEGTDGLVNLLGALIAMEGHHREQVTKGKRIFEAWKAKYNKIEQEHHIITKLVPFWISVDGDKTKFELIEDRVLIVNEIFTRRANGEGSSKIANDLTARGIPTPKGRSSVWHSSSVSKILLSDAVIGTLINNKGEKYEDYFPKIIDIGTFQRVRALRQQPPSVGMTPKAHPLTRLVKHDCGQTMRRVNKGAKAGGVPKLKCLGCNVGIPFTRALELVTQALFETQYIAAPTHYGEEILGLDATVSALTADAEDEYLNWRKNRSLESRQQWERVIKELNECKSKLSRISGANTEVLSAIEEKTLARASHQKSTINALRAVATEIHFNHDCTELSLYTISGKVVKVYDLGLEVAL